MKRYTLSFIVLVLAIGIPFFLINPGQKHAMSGDARLTRETLNDALSETIKIATTNYYKPTAESNEMLRGAIKGFGTCLA